MKFSVAFASQVDSWRWVKRAEELGYHAAWFYDTQLLNPDVFICMALAAHETSTIRLGTGVLVPSNRIAPVAANALASLNRLAPGRIDFGVGTGFTARRTMGQRPVTLGNTKRYIQTVQTMLRGEIAEWSDVDGTHKVKFLDPDLGLVNIEDDIPLWFSAFGPKSQQLAADLKAGWINFGLSKHEAALGRMQRAWQTAGHDVADLDTNLFFLGAVLSGDDAADEAKLMAQAAPQAAMIFHGMADEADSMDVTKTKRGPLAEPFMRYLEQHASYEPADAKYLENHKGHLIYVRPEETHITPEIVKATTFFSGKHEELVRKLRDIRDMGYRQVTVQVVHGHESAIEEWAEVFRAV
jgi:5,10-methylenetetrahydromethanopterin reductase